MYLKTKLIIILILASLGYLIFLKPVDISFKAKEADQIVGTVLNNFKVYPQDLLKETHEFKKSGRYRFETIIKTYSVESDFPFDLFKGQVIKPLSPKRIHLLGWERNRRENFVRIDFGFKRNKIYTLFLRTIRKKAEEKEPLFKKAKIAIVIDDFGYSLNHFDSWLKFPRAITFSILPNLAYSTRIAELADLNGRELILHLPLEPQDTESEPAEQFTITTSMSKKEILKILDRAIETVPYLKGVSNHQGSKATEDVRLMEIIFRELKKKNLFFLDSLVTHKSVCANLANHFQMRFVQRDLFLDNVNEIEYIRNQLNILADLAQKTGFAIGIGHDRIKTLQALEASYPELESRGIEFVYLSELVK